MIVTKALQTKSDDQRQRRLTIVAVRDAAKKLNMANGTGLRLLGSVPMFGGVPSPFILQRVCPPLAAWQFFSPVY